MEQIYQYEEGAEDWDGQNHRPPTEEKRRGHVRGMALSKSSQGGEARLHWIS